MTFIRSTLNQCSYILSEGEDLMAAAFLPGGLVETARSAYVIVDPDVLTDDERNEAFRCYNILLESLEE